MLFDRVLTANKANDDFQEFVQAISKGERRHRGVGLEDYRVVDGALFKKGLLWVPGDQRTEVIQEVHDQPSTGHVCLARTLDMLKRHFYWPGCSSDVRRYIRNYYPCQRSKAPRDKANGLLQPLPIPD